MNDALKILYILCFSLAVISFCTAIFIFFKFRIVEVIQDLNGTIAKRQIEMMRERNEHAKNFGAGLLDVEMGKTGKTGKTDKIGRTGKMGMTDRIGKTGKMGMTDRIGRTGKIGITDDLGRTGNMAQTANKSIAISSLTNQNSMGVGAVENGTTLLQNNTAVNPNFIIIKNIVFINTSESI